MFFVKNSTCDLGRLSYMSTKMEEEGVGGGGGVQNRFFVLHLDRKDPYGTKHTINCLLHDIPASKQGTKASLLVRGSNLRPMKYIPTTATFWF